MMTLCHGICELDNSQCGSHLDRTGDRSFTQRNAADLRQVLSIDSLYGVRI